MNNNSDVDGGVRNQNGDQDQDRDHQIPGHLLQLAPRPRNVTFTMSGRQVELMYITWAAARNRVRQQLYNPNLPFQPYPLPPVWSDEMRAMMVLWIARERRIFEMEIEELECLLGLRDRTHEEGWKFQEAENEVKWLPILDTCTIQCNTKYSHIQIYEVVVAAFTPQRPSRVLLVEKQEEGLNRTLVV
ncbi:uncharacterized protein BJ212DRAFT_1479744 [Suillus subaureus]|uniref:Uncharacterized protein n=1 Tax=Suillus subaureus TaxID=48587 RepID=A0A9P7ECK3_9AGAM|nr:uncharacterized protein BJ212DRAFT_1479744 [Suillus subaureus]KAG1817917.1 hypothetical protein BJ212DRAFT_1479744 [Suillus subaureus]